MSLGLGESTLDYCRRENLPPFIVSEVFYLLLLGVFFCGAYRKCINKRNIRLKREVFSMATDRYKR